MLGFGIGSTEKQQEMLQPLQQISNLLHYRKILALLGWWEMAEPTFKCPKDSLKTLLQACLGGGVVYHGKGGEVAHKGILQMGSK